MTTQLQLINIIITIIIIIIIRFHSNDSFTEPRGHWLQARKSRLRFPMSLGSSQCLGYLLLDKGSRNVGLTTLTHTCGECLEILGSSGSWNPIVLFQPVTG